MLIRYKVKKWDETEPGLSTECGFVIGTSLGEGVNRIVDYYGEDTINEISVYECEEIIPDFDLENMLNT